MSKEKCLFSQDCNTRRELTFKYLWLRLHYDDLFFLHSSFGLRQPMSVSWQGSVLIIWTLSTPAAFFALLVHFIGSDCSYSWLLLPQAAKLKFLFTTSLWVCWHRTILPWPVLSFSYHPRWEKNIWKELGQKPGHDAWQPRDLDFSGYIDSRWNEPLVKKIKGKYFSC